MNIDEETLRDEEKSFVEWMQTIILKSNDISIIRKAYLDGFAAGWSYKKQMLAQEQLQK